MTKKEQQQLATCWAVVDQNMSMYEAARRLKLTPNGVGRRFITLLKKQHNEQNEE